MRVDPANSAGSVAGVPWFARAISQPPVDPQGRREPSQCGEVGLGSPSGNFPVAWKMTRRATSTAWSAKRS